MSTLKQRLQDDQKEAMKSRAKDRLGTLRLIMAALKQKEVDERVELNDADIVAILDKMMKQRRESISQYEVAGRTDLAEKEAAEIKVIQEFLPSALTDAEIEQLISETVSQLGASTVKDMGKVMGVLTPKVKGRADMGAISSKVKSKLGG